MIACAVTDLPQPDSPRMPRVSPALSEKLTLFTAWAMPSRVWNSTWRSSTSSSGAEVSKLSWLSDAAARFELVGWSSVKVWLMS